MLTHYPVQPGAERDCAAVHTGRTHAGVCCSCSCCIGSHVQLADYKENLDVLKGLSLSKYQQDCLIVGGDVSDDMAKLSESLQLCRKRFKAVWFTPGELCVSGSLHGTGR